MKVKVNVTQEDIDRGIPVSASSCPVALATKRALGEEYRYVGATQASIYADNGHADLFAWNLPASVSNFIRNFDGRLDVRPFSFTVLFSVQPRPHD